MRRMIVITALVCGCALDAPPSADPSGEWEAAIVAPAPTVEVPNAPPTHELSAPEAQEADWAGVPVPWAPPGQMLSNPIDVQAKGIASVKVLASTCPQFAAGDLAGLYSSFATVDGVVTVKVAGYPTMTGGVDGAFADLEGQQWTEGMLCVVKGAISATETTVNGTLTETLTGTGGSCEMTAQVSLAL